MFRIQCADVYFHVNVLFPYSFLVFFFALSFRSISCYVFLFPAKHFLLSRNIITAENITIVFPKNHYAKSVLLPLSDILLIVQGLFDEHCRSAPDDSRFISRYNHTSPRTQ